MKTPFRSSLLILCVVLAGLVVSCATAPVVLDRFRSAPLHMEFDADSGWFEVRVTGIAVDEESSTYSARKIPAGAWLNTHPDAFDGTTGPDGLRLSFVWDLAVSPDVFPQMAISYKKGDRGTLNLKVSYLTDDGKLVQQSFSAPDFDGKNGGRTGVFRLPLKVADEETTITPADQAAIKAELTAAIQATGLEGTWYFQGEGAGSASDTHTWTTAKLIIDPRAGTFQFFERPGQPLVGWKNPTAGPKQTIIAVTDRTFAYVGPASDGYPAPGLIFWKLEGGDLKWWWANTDTTESRSFRDYVIFRKTPPGQ